MSIRPRPYQEECVSSVFNQFEDYQSVLAVLATGLGKTVIFCTVAKRWQVGRVLMLAHREELITQAGEEVRGITGEIPAIEMAAERADSWPLLNPSRIVLASVQSLCRPQRLARFRPEDFGLVIIDEAHHAVSTTYQTILNHFRRNERLRVLGVTATPKRHDKLAMGQIFDSVAYEYGIEPASKDGWLVKVQQQRVVVDGLDFSKVRQTNGDLNERDLEAVLNQEKILHAIAAPTVEIAGDRSTLVFCVTVEHATRLCEVFERYKKHSCAVVSGKTDREKRREIVDAFKRGQLQFLLNCGVFLEGFNAPRTELICMARPTNSLALYTQVIGRATRPLKSTIDHLDEATPAERCAAIAASAKPSMLILDFKGNAGKHKIVTADDLLGGKFAAPVKKYAAETIEKEGCAVGVEESLDRAEAELALLEEERLLAEKRAKIKAEAEYRTQAVGLFGGTSARRADSVAQPAPTGDMATEKQINYLAFLGVPREKAMTYTKKQAGKVIDVMTRKNKEAS